MQLQPNSTLAADGAGLDCDSRAQEGREQEEPPRTGWVREDRVDALRESFAEAARRCAKMGVPAPTVEPTGREQWRRHRSERHPDRSWYAHWYEFRVQGDRPRLAGGWRLLAAIDHSDGAPIVRQVPGVDEFPAEQRARGAFCDHCNTERRRNTTYVLRNAEGQIAQVGSSCLAEFLGVAALDPDYLLMLAGYLKSAESAGEDDEPGDEPMPREHVRFAVLDVVSTALAVIERFGWVSRARSREAVPPLEATCDVVLNVLWGAPPQASDELRQVLRELREAADERREAASGCLEWARLLVNRTRSSEYERNLVELAHLEYIGAKNIGILASLPAAYLREQERLNHARPGVAAKMEHVGAIGERLRLRLRIAGAVTRHEGAFGDSLRVPLQDEQGRRFLWWTASYDRALLSADEFREVAATVKRHEDREGFKNTVLTRVGRPAKPRAAKRGSNDSAAGAG